jgi:hypothetical protein
VTTKFVGGIIKGYTGMRWGEIVGLETEFVRPKSLRVEGQLYELDTGELHRCPPKDDSYRDIDTPDFLASLLAGHIARTRPKPCECHGLVTEPPTGLRAARGRSWSTWLAALASRPAPFPTSSTARTLWRSRLG